MPYRFISIKTLCVYVLYLHPFFFFHPRIKLLKVPFGKSRRFITYYYFILLYFYFYSPKERVRRIVGVLYTPRLQSCAVVRNSNHVVSTLASWSHARGPRLYRVAGVIVHLRNITILLNFEETKYNSH